MIQMSLDDMATELHDIAVEKGFWDVIKDASQEQKDIFMTKQLMMIVSEAVEVMEAIRKNRGPEDIADEMADIIIRTLDLYAGLREEEYVNESLQVAFNKKTSFNKSRPEKHGVKF
jgi:NTP pyrophosphatase (non-canonical NTP hydrolase)